MKSIYRILSPTAILGYGFPESSFQMAMELDIDLIAVDAGSVDAGPHYLGSDKHYVSAAALQRDLTWMIQGALKQRCPCIIGSAGFSGADPQFTDLVRMIQTIIREQTDQAVRLASIDAGISPSLLMDHVDKLIPLGRMPEIDTNRLCSSKIVGQMGIEPIITALEEGAQIIVCGRAYDPAVFAADPIRNGFDPGISFHAGKILECGAIACSPGSGSDCLIAEIYKDGYAEFFCPSTQRKTTPETIAAHSLYEKTRPDFFYLPGGCLDIQKTQFFSVDDKRAGIRGSRFISSPPSIKLEGSRPIGSRKMSVVPLFGKDEIDGNIQVYGRNGVESSFSGHEMGMVVLVMGANADVAHNVLASIRSTLLHFGYSNRMSTAGNLAFPSSPSDIDTVLNGISCTFFIAGTRDPIFRREWEKTQIAVIDHVKTQLPDLVDQCDIKIFTATSSHPIAFVEGIGNGSLYEQQMAQVRNFKTNLFQGLEDILIGTVYEWSIHHLLLEKEILKKLFPVQISEWNGCRWKTVKTLPCNWRHGVQNKEELPNERIAHTAEIPLKNTNEKMPIMGAAHIIRSKNAGINELTFDILFSGENFYQRALNSGVFTRENMAKILGLSSNEIIGCYKFDIVRAIKITIHRKCLAGSPGDRDVFGAQQQSRIMALDIPF